jgi:hypothetical protein
MEVDSLQQDIIELMPKRKGRKPKNADEIKVWSNPDYRKQYYKTYYETKRPKEYVTCECGTQCKIGHMRIHELTKHHQQYVELKHKLTQSILLNNTCK